MFEFLTTFELLLQHLTNWLSYAAIVLALVLAVGQLIYFIIEKKENRHGHF